jgi:hypothetical protein
MYWLDTPTGLGLKAEILPTPEFEDNWLFAVHICDTKNRGLARGKEIVARLGRHLELLPRDVRRCGSFHFELPQGSPIELNRQVGATGAGNKLTTWVLPTKVSLHDLNSASADLIAAFAHGKAPIQAGEFVRTQS